MKIVRKSPVDLNLKSTPQQTVLWSEVKKKQGYSTHSFQLKTPGELISRQLKGCTLADDILIIEQALDNENSIGYIPYGPQIEPDEDLQGTFLEELSESLRPLLPKKCCTLRYDLKWESLWAKDEDLYEHNIWSGPPAPENQEIRLNFNTHNHNLRKSLSDNLPAHTIFLDLSLSSEELLMQMKAKTRYNIRLSQRKGVRVHSYGIEKLNVWYDLYRQTASRNGILLHDINYFKSFLETKSSFTGTEVQLLIADYAGIPLAAMFLVITDKRGTYLYGASSSEKRNYMATYALQWEAITRAKSFGCKEYDLFGISPNPDPSHPLYGLFRFKSGFGGNQFHRMGCWDYPISSNKYNSVRLMEMTSQGYHI